MNTNATQVQPVADDNGIVTLPYNYRGASRSANSRFMWEKVQFVHNILNKPKGKSRHDVAEEMKIHIQSFFDWRRDPEVQKYVELLVEGKLVFEEGERHTESLALTVASAPEPRTKRKYTSRVVSSENSQDEGFALMYCPTCAAPLHAISIAVARVAPHLSVNCCPRCRLDLQAVRIAIAAASEH